jgi:flap endonuclease-1
VEELTKFLVDESGFNPDRVKANIEKLQKAFKSTSKPQARMDSFFKVKANPNAKKIAEKKKAAAKSDKKKAGGFFGKRKR